MRPKLRAPKFCPVKAARAVEKPAAVIQVMASIWAPTLCTATPICPHCAATVASVKENMANKALCILTGKPSETIRFTNRALNRVIKYSFPMDELRK